MSVKIEFPKLRIEDEIISIIKQVDDQLSQVCKKRSMTEEIEENFVRVGIGYVLSKLTLHSLLNIHDNIVEIEGYEFGKTIWKIEFKIPNNINVIELLIDNDIQFIEVENGKVKSTITKNLIPSITTLVIEYRVTTTEEKITKALLISIS